jgi:predicted kinase
MYLLLMLAFINIFYKSSNELFHFKIIATNITLQMIEQLIDLLEPYKPSIKIIYLEVQYKKLLSQNNDRNFAIPASAIEKMIDKLEVLKEWEAAEVEYVIG